MKDIKEVQNVVGISEGDDYWNDKNTTTIFVKKKLAMSTINKYIRDPRKPWTKADVIPKELNGKPTDVIEIGDIKAHADRNVYRPVQGGCEINIRGQRFVGTAGAVVYYKKIGKLSLVDQWYSFLRLLKKWGVPVKTQKAFITNAHVTQLNVLTPDVTQIAQPGYTYSGRIGEAEYTIPISATETNEYDVSLVTLDVDCSPEILQVGKLTGHRSVEKDEEVHKYGRTTQYTTGKCLGRGVSVRVDYDLPNGPVWFKDLDLYNRISDRGDSGSVIVAKKDNKVVSLLFAGSSTVTLGIPIQKIVDRLRISFVEDEND